MIHPTQDGFLGFGNIFFKKGFKNLKNHDSSYARKSIKKSLKPNFRRFAPKKLKNQRLTKFRRFAAKWHKKRLNFFSRFARKGLIKPF